MPLFMAECVPASNQMAAPAGISAVCCSPSSEVSKTVASVSATAAIFGWNQVIAKKVTLS